MLPATFEPEYINLYNITLIMNLRQQFLQNIAQTTNNPLAIEFVKAHAATLTDANGKEHIDLIGGISVCNIGHSHPAVVKAVQEQAAAYMHTMVYGELIQAPQVQYATALTKALPEQLNCVYFTNSGTEATEGAMKLAKRVTGKTNFIACNQSYHGSTQGALSIMGSEYFRNAFRPLLPNVFHYDYNSMALPEAINHNTAAVFIEVVQAESGVIPAQLQWLQAIREACNKHCCLLVFDEIQSAFGRTGKLFAFEHYGIVPDILLLGKALGGGMPLGAFIAHKKIMDSFTDNPILGHITTFGGHPVSCAAGLAAFTFLQESILMQDVKMKEDFIKQQLPHNAIKSINTFGLWAAIEFDSFDTNKKIIDYCINQGVFTDWFLFKSNALRLGPPLCITTQQLAKAIEVIHEGIEKFA
jgi:acetylornithine/N-succinyldiaminopimelate aminotransferase